MGDFVVITDSTCDLSQYTKQFVSYYLGGREGIISTGYTAQGYELICYHKILF